MKKSLVVLFWVNSFLLFSQSQVKHLFSHAVFQNYYMRNGLSSNYCYDVLQDERGSIWVATLNGLDRYNGNKWENFQQQSSNPKKKLQANWVMDLDEEKGKGIWINTDHGIAFFDFSTAKITRFKEPIKGWGKLISLGGNQIMVSSWSGLELFSKSNNTLKSVKYYSESAKNSFPLLYRGKYGSIWTCPEDRPCLIRVDEKTKKLDYITQINLKGKVIRPIVQGILQINKNTLLLATKQHGILSYSISENQAVQYLEKTFPKSISYAPLQLLNSKNSSFLVVGTKGEGLIIADTKSGGSVKLKHNDFNPTSLCSNEINDLCIDNNEGLWISTTMGLSYFHPSLQKNKRFYFHNRLASGQSLLINTVFELDDKWFLIGTDTKGLFLFDSQNDELKAIPSPATQISSIRKTPIGVLIGSNNGTFLWDESKKKVIHKAILTQRTLNIRVLNKCYTAICTNVGLCILDQKGKVFRIEEKNTLSEKLMCKDALLIDNQLWILRFFDGWEVRSFDSNELKFHSRLIDLDFPIDYHGISASKDAVFIASSAGLIRQEIKNINHLKHYKTQDGLIGDRIENILIGRRNELYYTTIDGLYQFNDDLKKSHRLVSYENYIQKWYNQLDFGNNHSLVYTVSDNFCVFYTKDNYFNEKTPNLKPEAIWVNSQPWNLNKELRLPHLSNNIRIQFGACVYPESSKNRWIYRLVGKKSPKPHWKESSGEITLQYLPPDEYVLEYFSRNNEGKQSLHIEKLAITITSPFYATYWFFILILVLVIALFLLLYSYKQYQNKRLIRIRNQISRDLHDELGANVSSIHIMANLLQQRPNSPQATTALKNISRYSVQISDTINDIIWNVNPQFDSMDELIKRMTRFASETIESAQIDYDIVVPEVIPMMKLDNQTKYHLYLLFKECINNAVKHAKSNCIQILFEFAGKRFFFSVEDNGVGFEIEKKANGNGLANIQHRANEINATLTIETSLEKGTKINLSIQLS